MSWKCPDCDTDVEAFKCECGRLATDRSRPKRKAKQAPPSKPPPEKKVKTEKKTEESDESSEVVVKKEGGKSKGSRAKRWNEVLKKYGKQLDELVDQKVLESLSATQQQDKAEIEERLASAQRDYNSMLAGLATKRSFFVTLKTATLSELETEYEKLNNEGKKEWLDDFMDNVKEAWVEDPDVVEITGDKNLDIVNKFSK